MQFKAKVLTVSDSAHEGLREDCSGPVLVETLGRADFAVVSHAVVSDDLEQITGALLRMCSDFQGLVVTTGGTGFSPTDRTPEATRRVIDRQAPGLAEAMRAANPLGRLSRGVAGTTGNCLIVNVPGSTAGARESIEAILDVLPHALDLLQGNRPH